MRIRHKVKINIADRKGNQCEVMHSGFARVPTKILHLLFGDFSEILILGAGKTVEGIEIQETVRREGTVPKDDPADREDTEWKKDTKYPRKGGNDQWVTRETR